MIKPITKDIFFLNQKSEDATPADAQVVNLPMINPVIVKKSGAYETEEGCLSLSGVVLLRVRQRHMKL